MNRVFLVLILMLRGIPLFGEPLLENIRLFGRPEIQARLRFESNDQAYLEYTTKGFLGLKKAVSLPISKNQVPIFRQLAEQGTQPWLVSSGDGAQRIVEIESLDAIVPHGAKKDPIIKVRYRCHYVNPFQKAPEQIFAVEPTESIYPEELKGPALVNLKNDILGRRYQVSIFASPFVRVTGVSADGKSLEVVPEADLIAYKAGKIHGVRTFLLPATYLTRGSADPKLSTLAMGKHEEAAQKDLNFLEYLGQRELIKKGFVVPPPAHRNNPEKLAEFLQSQFARATQKLPGDLPPHLRAGDRCRLLFVNLLN